MNRLPNLNPFGLVGCYVAGGAVLSSVTKTEINDYDVYPKSKKNMIDIFHILCDNHCFVVNISDRAITFKSNTEKKENGERMVVQVMTFDEFDSPEKIFNYFDFTVVMGAFDCDTNSYHFHEDFYPDITSKTLRFNTNTRYPLNSLLRITKYKNKGFNISKPEMVKMAMSVAKAGLPNSWEELESQIGGSYGREIRLNCGDREYSYETAIEVLDDLSPDFENYMIGSEDYSDCTSDILEILYGDTNKKCEYIYSDECLISTHVLVEDNKIGTAFTKKQMKILENAGRLTRKETGKIYGYKVLVKENDVLFPGVNRQNNITYAVGTETEWNTSPYLYVFPNVSQAIQRKKTISHSNKDVRLFYVSFDVNDIKSLSSHEIQVSKMKLEHEIGET